MQQFFESRRFGKYFSYQVKTGWKKYLTYLGSTLLVLFFMMVLAGLFAYENEYSMSRYYNEWSSPLDLDPMWGMEMGWFWFAIFAVCIYSASATFGDLSDKNGRIFSLMVPASQLEKYLTRWIILGPFTLVLIVGGCELVDALRCLILSIRFPHAENIHLLGGQLFDFTSSEWKGLIGSFLFLQSVSLLGSSIWPKNPLVKTLLALTVISFVCSLWGGLLMKIFYDPDMVYGVDTVFDKYTFEPENLFLGITIAIALVNYVVAYFRYREIEIVQRW